MNQIDRLLDEIAKKKNVRLPGPVFQEDLDEAIRAMNRAFQQKKIKWNRAGRKNLDTDIRKLIDDRGFDKP